MLTVGELYRLESQRKYFIEHGEDASLFQWLSSKGTNYSCYLEYLNSCDDEDKINNKIDTIRNILNIIDAPFQFTFFYWTLLIFIINKFSFKKLVLKIILVHFILRSFGDALDKSGNLLQHYFANKAIKNTEGEVIGFECTYDVTSPEMHPLRWFLTRQLACFFWYTGEIVADWYSLIRCKTILWESKYMWIVYVSCGMFNFSKFVLMLYQIALYPTRLYDRNGIFDDDKVDNFYFFFYYFQLMVIYASAIYDLSVYFILKKNISRKDLSQFEFIKKFKVISEYRIMTATVFNFICIPILTIAIIVKFYFMYRYNYHNIECSFDSIRSTLTNFRYFMMFIDQILLKMEENPFDRSSLPMFTNVTESNDDSSVNFDFHNISDSNLINNNNNNNNSNNNSNTNNIFNNNINTNNNSNNSNSNSNNNNIKRFSKNRNSKINNNLIENNAKRKKSFYLLFD